ncbi:hypothetical protein LQZ19_15020, partial [Treponema primitia]|uniref:hypothetical protein n=1 Tax=Treponema primitia TaxID=88058 RepID=UPI0039813E1F
LTAHGSRLTAHGSRLTAHYTLAKTQSVKYPIVKSPFSGKTTPSGGKTALTTAKMRNIKKRNFLTPPLGAAGIGIDTLIRVLSAYTVKYKQICRRDIKP